MFHFRYRIQRIRHVIFPGKEQHTLKGSVLDVLGSAGTPSSAVYSFAAFSGSLKKVVNTVAFISRFDACLLLGCLLLPCLLLGCLLLPCLLLGRLLLLCFIGKSSNIIFSLRKKALNSLKSLKTDFQISKDN